MNTYFNSLLALILLCELALCLIPQENFKKTVTVLCSAAVLLTLLSPLKTILSSRDAIRERIAAIWGTTEKAVDAAETGEEQSKTNPYREVAAVLFSYLSEKYPKSTKDAKITIVTDEADAVCEIQFFLPTATNGTCLEIENHLAGQFDEKISVFGGQHD